MLVALIEINRRITESYSKTRRVFLIQFIHLKSFWQKHRQKLFSHETYYFCTSSWLIHFATIKIFLVFVICHLSLSERESKFKALTKSTLPHIYIIPVLGLQIALSHNFYIQDDKKESNMWSSCHLVKLFSWMGFFGRTRPGVLLYTHTVSTTLLLWHTL